MLIKCPECGNMRSDEADACPHCGCKRKEASFSSGCATFILLGLFLFGSKMCGTDTMESYITKNRVNYRTVPNGQILGKLPKGTEVFCSSVDNGWCRTKKDDRDVYISLKVLIKNAPMEEKGVSERKNPVEETAPVKKKKGLISAIGE